MVQTTGGGIGKKHARRYSDYFRVAEKLGKHLHELLGWPSPMTHRQWLAWLAWQDNEWNEPDRHDWYLMALGCMWAEKGTQPKDMKLKFQSDSPEEKLERQKAQQKANEAALLAHLGVAAALSGGPGLRVRLPDGTLIDESDPRFPERLKTKPAVRHEEQGEALGGDRRGT